MRSFVTIIILAAIIGLFTARQQFALHTRDNGAIGTLVKLSDIAAGPLQQFVPQQAKPKPEPLPPVNEAGILFEKKISAQSAIVVDEVTDAVLYEKNADEARPLASISKLMSALIIVEHIDDWSATTTIEAEDIGEGNQTIAVGEVYTLHDLFNAALVGSYNTAINTLVRATGLSRTAFAGEMNQRALDLGMRKMHFAEATGLSPENVASARDVARLTKIILSEPRIKITTLTEHTTITDLHTHKKKIVKATDWLVSSVVKLDIAAVEGGKTGYIPESGYNFTVELKNHEGHEIRVVVLGSKDVFSRFTETADLATWAFQNYSWENILSE